jgi:ADP-ribose pyrophosphatase
MSTDKNWKLIKQEDVSPSKWFPLYKDTVQLPNGKIVEDYYVSKLGDVSMVVAITKNKEIVFVRQYKHGARQLTTELPAGRIGDKTPQEAAIAELQEETGFIVDSLIPIGFTLSIPSKDSTKVYGFVVKDVEIKTKQNFDENEDIEVILVPLSELDKYILSGEFNGSDSIAILHLAQLKYPELFK